MPDRPDRVIERVDRMRPVPIEASVIASDAIHQARAALDNLIGLVRPGGPTGHSGFPIADTEADYLKAATEQLAGVQDWASNAVLQLQPFHIDGPYWWIGRELSVLHRLARTDRHRALHLQSAFVAPSHVFSDEGADVEFRGDLHTWAETEYTRFKVHRVNFEVEVRFAADVPGAADLEVVPTIDGLITAVLAAVEVIERASAATP